jgi:hypothetical protein
MARNPESLRNLVPGNKRGPAKTTRILKDAILQAAEEAGGPDGIVGYLRVQAVENPGPFMTLLGKVLPTQTALTDADGNSVGGKFTLEFIAPASPGEGPSSI